MAMKIVLITVLALATVDIVYSQTRDEDTQLVKSYFNEKSHDKLEKLWNIFLHKAEESLLNAKQQSLREYERKGKLTDAFKNKWNIDLDLAIKYITEIKDIINELRSKAPTQAPAEWNQMSELTIKLWNADKVSAATLDPFKLEETLNSGMHEFYQFSAKLKNKLGL